MSSDIPLIDKTYRFYCTLHTFSKNYPKRDQYTIGQKSKNITLEILELLYSGKHRDNSSKIKILKKTDIKLQLLKTLIRATYETDAISKSKYIQLQEDLDEIGKMLGGWIKSLK